MEKTCSKCKAVLPISSFSRKTGTALSSWCKACHSSYHRKHYRKFPEKYKAESAARKIRLRDKIRAIKDGKPCFDCGVSYPWYVMQFDHIPGNGKKFELGRASQGGWAERTIDAEIAKCELVCANCHAVRTFERRS